MVKKTRLKRQTFAEIVADVDAAALAPAVVAEITPGRFNGETLYDLEGHALVRSDDRSLYPFEVQTAVLAGVRLVWDACGCRGHCNVLEWVDPVALRKAAERSAPVFRKGDAVEVHTLTGAGGKVLLASGGLRWESLFR